MARQSTFMKATTAYSWELYGEDKCFVPEGALFRVSSLTRVTTESELGRNDNTGDHREIVLTPRSTELMHDLHGTWYIYSPHWVLAPATDDNVNLSQRTSGKRVIAQQDTYLKRSTGLSWDLATSEKLLVAAGEVVVPLKGPRPVGSTEETARHAHAGAHKEVILSSEELQRLWSKSPRVALCRYFASEGDALLRELRDCFSNAQFGPGALPSAAGGSGAAGGGGSAAGDVPALLLPHGGFCNSGFVAAHGYRLLDGCRQRVAFVVGTNHQSWYKFALSDQTWATPIGAVEPELRIVEELRALGYPVDRTVHAEEHSIENQVPFLRFVRPDIRIVPIGVGSLELAEAERLAEHIARLVQENDAILLGTTDFSHEGPSYGGPEMSIEEVTDLTRSKDGPLLESVQDMDAARLLTLSKGSSMCGPGSTAVFLLACHNLGLNRAKQLRYLVNTEVTPCTSTTGFASFSFSRDC